MNYPRKIILLLFCMALNSLFILGSNVQITNMTQANVDNDIEVTFDLTWDYAWRKDNVEPYNYDGVWVFIKYRDCLEKAGGNPGNYAHAHLSQTLTDHSAGTDTINVDGTDHVTNLALTPGISNVSGDDRIMGFFVHLANGDTVGNVRARNVTFRWDFDEHTGLDNTNSYDIQVFAIEMVFIPQDSFYVGDGYYNGQTQCYYDAAQGSNYPFQINGINLDLEATGGDYAGLTAGSGSPNIDNNWPNGYDSIWVMKYEISQEQYMRFLNTLSREAQDNRTETNLAPTESSTSNIYVMANSATMQNRNAIVCPPNFSGGGEPIIFKMDYDGDQNYNESADGGNIACNYLSGFDVMAYLDWASLRPMTSFEFEKVGHGPYKKPYGSVGLKAWGTTELTAVTGINNEGQPDETYSNGGDVEGIVVYGDNPSVQGPLRCGFAAKSTTSDRYSAGASYYGIFELSGNVHELALGTRWGGPTITDDYEGNAGNGVIDDVTGNASESGWPQDADGSGTGNNEIMSRGGHWAETSDYDLVISDREQGTFNNNNRYNYSGGRGCRYMHK